MLFDTSFGRCSLGLLAALLLLAVSLRKAKAASLSQNLYKRRRIWWWVGSGLALLALSTASGHASQAGSIGLAVLATTGHLLAGAMWLGGGLLYLGFGVLPALLNSPKDTPEANQLAGKILLSKCLDRFALVALASVGLLIITGIYQVTLHLSRPADLWQTAYGIILVIKHLLVALMLILSIYHLVRLRPGLNQPVASSAEWLYQRLGWIVRLEGGLGLVVLICVGGLATFPAPL